MPDSESAGESDSPEAQAAAGPVTVPRERGHSLSLGRLGPSLHYTALRHSLASLDTRM